MTAIEKQGAAAKAAALRLMTAGTNEKNKALLAIAEALVGNKEKILEANAADMAKAKENGMSAALQDRLALDSKRIDGIADGVLEVAALEDPIGQVDKMATRPSGLVIGRKKVPLGVIAIIYESRPNVTVDAAVLCLKSGNAVILRGGKEAFHSNNALTEIMRGAIRESGLPEDSVSLVQDTTRASATEVLRLSQYIAVLIPRGGAGLLRSVVEDSRVPVIETGVGNCHIYIESSADRQMGAEIIFNAKCSRPSVCNAAETLLVDRSVADAFLPMAKKLLDQKNTELRGDAETARILGDCVKPVTDEDYATEFVDYILAVKIVEGFDEAIAHINKYSSRYSEAIVTSSYAASRRFLDEVDAAAVYVNASTRFTDGQVFGLGAEIGISTQKMHARGPMGLEQLTSSKYIIYGNGQVR
ncbi:MAG: glutamate-5-semialdehyde dehydrogenase [Clostridiales bacterium]|nr:glutamate-5-semialdehyde dehydrogenase [Clostridiales bacterium]